MKMANVHVVEGDDDDKGSPTFPNRMNFRKSSEGGGGVIFNPTIYIAKFGPLNMAFSACK